MSRLATMSPAALKSLFAPETDDDLIMLLTIYDPSNPTTVSMRLCDGYTSRISETLDDVIYGTTSRGNNYIFLPIEVSLPSEDDANAPKCSLVLHDVTQMIVPTIRSLTGPPKVLLELVLASTPDTVEASFYGFYISNISYDANSINAELSMVDYQVEPFPAFSITPAYFPGLF